MKTLLNNITVGHDLYGREMLYTHGTAKQAQAMIDNSPIDDGVMMSTTTYHRAATMSDVHALKYNQDGEDVTI